jgi:hypothetical protein
MSGPRAPVPVAAAEHAGPLRARGPAVARAFVAIAAVSATAAAVAAAAPATGEWSRKVAVSVPARPSPAGNVTVRFTPHARLPRGGFYYAVAVLEHYGTGSGAAPSCAISSDMHRTEYGHRAHSGRVHLTLLPAPSAAGQWCPAGSYQGAIYAVPHPPPCTPTYPCYGRSSCGPAGGVCGVVPYYTYSYPGGLPPPLDRRSRIIGRFEIVFAPTRE